MLYIVLSFSFFLLSVVLHVLWCRFKRSGELQVVAFFLLAMAGLIFYVVTERFLLVSCFGGPESIWNLYLEMTSIVIFALLIPFYLVLYYSVNINSPSRMILLILEKSQGLTYKQLKEQVTDEKFIAPRLKDLVDNRCVAFDGNTYRLLPHMTAIGRMLNVYQKITGRPEGG